MSSHEYLARAALLLQRLDEQEGERIERVGADVARSVASGGIVHLFGSGHSHMAAEEPFVRAGTLTAVRAIWPQQITDRFERVPGLGAAVLSMDDVREGEVLFVISNSGRNPLPIDVALAGSACGAYVVGVGSSAHAQATPSRHPDGHHLVDVVDEFLDTHVPVGDALLSDLDGLPPLGPSSTLASVALINAVMVHAAVAMRDLGYEPPVRVSRNVPGGDAVNDRLAGRYGDRIPELR
ncbi:MAG: sugar isomerase domain-containing protein [Nocardioidaceae bacterium]